MDGQQEIKNQAYRAFQKEGVYRLAFEVILYF